MNKVRGKVLVQETLGSVATDAGGAFDLDYSDEAFREGEERAGDRPDLVLVVSAPESAGQSSCPINSQVEGRAVMIRSFVVVLALLASLASSRSRPIASQPGQPECKMGSDGRQVCGYNWLMGSDGIVACANTPDGRCAMSSDGRAVCSQVERPSAAGPPPECRMGSDGTQVCGYNCRLGSNGRYYCASIPDGHCALNSDGTFSCP